MGTDVPIAAALRRPHLRGAVSIHSATPEPPPGVEWSATAGSTPAVPVAASSEQQDQQNVSSPAGAPLSAVMDEIQRQYDLNVQETEHVEWMISDGLVSTIGSVFDLCENLQFPRRSPQAQPTASGLQDNPTSAFGAHDKHRTPTFPLSWDDEDVCPALPGQLPSPAPATTVTDAFQSPVSKAQRFFVGTTSPSHPQAPMPGEDANPCALPHGSGAHQIHGIRWSEPRPRSTEER